MLGAALALLVFTIPATSEPQQSIIVNGADEIIENPVSADPGLLTALAVAGPRVVVEYANHVTRLDLAAVPPAFQAVLDAMAERVVVEYANEIVREDLEAVPPGLQARLDQVAERVVFQYANANLAYPLAYPLELVDDTTPPVVTEIGAGPIAANGLVTVTWTTDEFADSTIFYGTASGSYPHTLADPLYVKAHALGLPGLAVGTTYYGQVRSVDLSGNATTSPEFSFTPELPPGRVYLPVVLRGGP
ncbi:MAG: hypothetical protein JXA93_02390 [Anaerolineae bacterium]|nr:hypothetical protein [Anaerolineae bacterium]